MDFSGLFAYLLVGAAVALIIAFAIAAAAVYVLGTHRQADVTAPFVAVLIGGVLLLLASSWLRLDFIPSIALLIAVAGGVAVTQRLADSPHGTRGWRVGWIGRAAWIGAAQGLFFGVLASFVSQDGRLVFVMLPIGAAVRGSWTAWEIRSASPGPPATGPEPTPSAQAAAGAISTTSVLPEPAQVSDAAAMLGETESPEIGLAAKLVGAAVILLFTGAVIISVLAHGADLTPRRLTIINRTTTPISLGAEPGKAGPFVPACATAAFHWQSRTLVPDTSGAVASVVPADAVVIDDQLFAYHPEAGPPAAWQVLVTSDHESGGPPQAFPSALPACQGVARSTVDFSGDGSLTTEAFRLVGSYLQRTEITAPSQSGCDFAAMIVGDGTSVQIVQPFAIPAGGHPSIADSRTFVGGMYRLSVTSGCHWEVRLEP